MLGGAAYDKCSVNTSSSRHQPLIVEERDRDAPNPQIKNEHGLFLLRGYQGSCLLPLYLLPCPSHQCPCCGQTLNHVWLFAIQWTVACQAPLSMGFSQQEYWSGLPFPPPGDLLNPGCEPVSLTSPALAGRFFTTSTTWCLWTLKTSSRSQRCAWAKVTTPGEQGEPREVVQACRGLRSLESISPGCWVPGTVPYLTPCPTPGRVCSLWLDGPLFPPVSPQGPSLSCWRFWSPAPSLLISLPRKETDYLGDMNAEFYIFNLSLWATYSCLRTWKGKAAIERFFFPRNDIFFLFFFFFYFLCRRVRAENNLYSGKKRQRCC